MPEMSDLCYLRKPRIRKDRRIVLEFKLKEMLAKCDG